MGFIPQFCCGVLRKRVNGGHIRRPENWEWRAHCPTVPLTSVTLPAHGARDILGHMADESTNPSRKPITAQNMDEAKAAAYANDPQTELVILGLGENAAVTTCGWARRFFDRGGLRLF